MSLNNYKNKEFTVEISDLNNLGYGVCRVDGIVTFVSGAVDGDTAQVKVIKAARDYMVARVEKIVIPSEFRTVSDCDSSGRCGGCVYDGITYAHELELKRRYVENAMRKKKLDVAVSPVIGDGRVWGWRNKVQYPVGTKGEIGYYRRNTNDIIETADCGLEAESLRGIAPFMAKLLKENGVSARHIYLRCGEGTGEVMACVVTGSAAFPNADKFAADLTKQFPSIVGVLQNINSAKTNVVLGGQWRLLWGREYIDDILCGCMFRLSPQSFYQVNRGCAEILYKLAAELVFGDGQSSAEGHPFKLVDLYCGIGTIGISIASMSKGLELTGVEITPKAVENAVYNAKQNGINADFICGEINDKYKLPGAVHTADAVIVDPPRKGLAAGLIKALSETEVKRVVYISCNPDTLARDIALFAECGFKCCKVMPVNMFPRTGHVELVALMSRIEE